MTVEAWIQEVWMDPERRARLFYALWLMSLGMVALGYLLIAQFYWQRGLFP